MTDHHTFLLVHDDFSELPDVRVPRGDTFVTDGSGRISVATGAYAAPVQLSIDRLESQPGVSGDEWEDVVEFSVRCSRPVVVAELFDGARAAVVSRPGWYRVRLSARGRDAGENRGEVGPRATIVEHYLMEIWSAPPADGITVRATSLQPVDHPAGRIHLAPARSAAARINRDLDRAPGHRPLSGGTGTATAQWTYPASPRKLFRSMAILHLWTSATWSGDSTPEVGARYWLWGNDYLDIWDGIPTSTRGHLEITVVQIARPTSIVSTWQWLDGRYYGEGEPMLARPTTVTVHLAPTGDAGEKRTTVQVRHDDLPIEWVDDMTAVWLCKLEAGRDVYPIDR